jgi:hypothetical protein
MSLHELCLCVISLSKHLNATVTTILRTGRDSANLTRQIHSVQDRGSAFSTEAYSSRQWNMRSSSNKTLIFFYFLCGRELTLTYKTHVFYIHKNEMQWMVLNIQQDTFNLCDIMFSGMSPLSSLFPRTLLSPLHSTLSETTTQTLLYSWMTCK